VTDGSSVIFDQTPPTLPFVGIVSSNDAVEELARRGVTMPASWDSLRNVATGMGSLAGKVNDDVTISILADEFIYWPSIEIWSGGQQLQNASLRLTTRDLYLNGSQSFNNRNFTFHFVTLASDLDGLITFNVSFSDSASNLASVVATTDGSSVIVDNTVPRILYVNATTSNPGKDRVAAVLDRFSLPNTCIPGLDEGCQYIPNESKGPILNPKTLENSRQWHTGTVMFYDTPIFGNGNESAAKPLFWNMSTGPNAAKLNDNVTLWLKASEFIYQPTCVFYFAETPYPAGQTAFAVADQGKDWDKARPNRTVLRTFTAPAQGGTRISYQRSTQYTMEYMQSRVVYRDTAPPGAGPEEQNLFWTCTYTVAAGDSDGPVAFTVYYDDVALISGTPVHNDGYTGKYTHGSVYVDKVAPVLKSVQIESNNVAVNNIGTLGDNMILTFASNEEIYTPECRFFSGRNDAVSGAVASYAVPAFRSIINSNTGLIEWSCSYEVLVADPTDSTKDLMDQNPRCADRQCDRVGLVTFEIHYSDIYGNAGPMVDRTMGSTLQTFLPCFGSFCMDPVQDHRFIFNREVGFGNGTDHRCNQRLPERRQLISGTDSLDAGFTGNVSYGSSLCNPNHPSLEGAVCEYGPSFAFMGQVCQMCPHPFVVDASRATCQACKAGEGPNFDHAPAIGSDTACITCYEGTTSAFGVCEACEIGSTANAERSECIDVDECSVNNGGCDMLATFGVEKAGATCVNLEPSTGGYRCGTCPPGLRTVVTSNNFFVDRLLTHRIVKRMGPVIRINGSRCLLPIPPKRPVDGSPYDLGVTVQPKITLKLTKPNCSAADIPQLRKKIAIAMQLRESDLHAMGCGSAASFHRRRLATRVDVPEVSFMLISPDAVNDARRFNNQLGYGTGNGTITPLIATGEILGTPFGANVLPTAIDACVV
jgi:hypothetical protein